MSFEGELAYQFGDEIPATEARGATKRNRDLAYDDKTGKLVLSQRGATLTEHGTVTATRQAVLIRLRTNAGEYYLDKTAGLEYFGGVLRKTPNSRVIRQRIMQQIKAVNGVVSVPNCEPVIDRTTRKLTVTFTATSLTGTFNGRT